MTFDAFKGRITDLDAHLQIPTDLYPDILGPAGEKIAADFKDIAYFNSGDGEVEATEESIWKVKGVSAPGAYTLENRLHVMDMMGISRQLVFPQVIVCFMIWGKDENAQLTMRNYNDHVCNWTKQSGGRIRAAAVLRTNTLDEMLEEADRVIANGAKAIFINEGRAPAGLSPADTDLDPFWARLAEADIPLLLHIGGQQGFFNSPIWGQAKAFKTGGFGAGEPVDTHLMSTVHMAPQNFVQTLILSGVLERHPGLNLGVIELGSHWVGPMADLMDMLIDQSFSKTPRAALSMKPSEYLSRQVRVTPYLMEDIATQIDRYGLEDVYAFSTDFPHEEGGRDPIGRMGGNVSRLGDKMLDRFFVTNGELLLPA